MASDAQIETNELVSATYEHITDVTFVLISHSSAPSSTSCSASPQRIGETLTLLPGRHGQASSASTEHDTQGIDLPSDPFNSRSIQ